MAGVCRITVEIPKKSYDIIRRRVPSAEHKTERVLSRYLFTFFTMLSWGEDSLYRAFSQTEARRLATLLDAVHRADDVAWVDLCTFPGARLGALIELFAPAEALLISKVAGLNGLEVLALVEYAQSIDNPSIFEKQTGKFKL